MKASEEKFLECFDEMAVYKNLKKINFFSTLSLPSFLRDWILKKFEVDDDEYDIEGIQDFVNTYMPKKDNWMAIKSRIVHDFEQVKILTKISVDVDISTRQISFSLPEYNLNNKETIIESSVWDEYKDVLTKGKEIWGVVELGYRIIKENKGKIALIGFTDFCPYEIDLDYYKELRSEFDIHEWIDILLGAIDYNCDAYADLDDSEYKKRCVLKRLLPFVEKRLNLVELAPKGTGKSYIFGSISKYGNLSAGTMTRAKLFYDNQKRKHGLVYNNDYIAFDEIHKISFDNPNEIGSLLQTYMENGKVSFSGHSGTADAGIIILGNIDQNIMDENAPMFKDLPTLFHDTAMLDRFHGFIKGWEIPKMTDNMKISGWGLNSEYFCSILHKLRDDVSYRTIVDAILEYPENSYIRDVEAVKRIATAYLKLLFPNVKTVNDIKPIEFNIYCLRPATEMRRIIRIQQALLDDEYKGKDIPKFTIRESFYE
jgi:ATP-dependent Lon protease